MRIVGTDTCDDIRLITVHIDQRLKVIFLATVKQPVDLHLYIPELQMKEHIFEAGND